MVLNRRDSSHACGILPVQTLSGSRATIEWDELPRIDARLGQMPYAYFWPLVPTKPSYYKKKIIDNTKKNTTSLA